MKTSMAALAAALVIGASVALVPSSGADAQLVKARERERQRQQPQQPQQGQVPNLSREESEAVRPLLVAVQASDWAAAGAALPAAQAGARTPAARYLVGQLQLQLGRGTQNQQLQAQAVDAMVASGGAPAEAMPTLLGAQVGLALDANNVAAAEGPLTRLVELNPNDVSRITQLAQVKARLNKRDEALTLFRRGMQLSEASGQVASEDLHRGALALAYEGRMAQPALELGRNLITHYPTPANWRAVLGIYRELGNPGPGVELDLYRLMRATQALNSEADFVGYAEAANRGAMFGEVKAVLEQGFGRNAITPGNTPYAREMLSTATRRIAEDQASLTRERQSAMAGSDARAVLRIADAYYGYGQYAEAATLYRAALQKGGQDANMVNTRLGAALALAGQRAEAEAAFRAVTGPHAELARFWLLWLSRRA